VRVILKDLGAEPVELVSAEAVKALFSNLADPLLGEASPAFANVPIDMGGHKLDLWQVTRYESDPALDAYLGTARSDAARRLSAAFLGRLINMAVVQDRVRALDGLLVAGGQDLNPLIYADKNDGSGTPHKTRDIVELAFIGEALRQKKPLFTICRGSQILAVALGGRLIQDLPTRFAQLGKRHGLDDEVAKSKGHAVRVLGSSTLARVLHLPQREGPKDAYAITVNSYHHQAVESAVEQIEVGAYDQPDNGAAHTDVIEGYVVKRDHFVVGTQWHPERPFAAPGEKAAFVLERSRLLPKERPHDRAVFDSFMTCVRREAGCSAYLYRP
jgi:putative glutamine amidotransferase